MPAHVYIWPNGWGPTAYNHPGHAAVHVQQYDKSASRIINDVYISWWPKGSDGGTKANGRPATNHSLTKDLKAEMSTETRRRLNLPKEHPEHYEPRAGQGQIGKEGQKVWVQFPQHIVTIPGLGETMLNPTGIGLNLERILDWWDVFRLSPNRSYRFVSRTVNCASVAAAALMAGGASIVLGKKSVSHTWSTPNDVLEYATRVRDKLLKVSRDSAEFRKYKFTVPAMQNLAPGTVMTERQFKELSYVGKFARRKEQVAALDSLLQRYHALGPDFGDDKAEQRMELLQSMLEQIHDHLRTKPNSSRAEAVLILGHQVVDTIRKYFVLAAMYTPKICWLPDDDVFKPRNRVA